MLSRRQLCRRAALVGAGGAWWGARGAGAWATEDGGDQGVASGDPLPDRVTLWTRVPEAFQPTGQGDVDVVVEVSEDPGFAAASLRHRGAVQASAAGDYTVRYVAEGLEPYKTYWYRFKTPTGYASVTGRTKIAPAPGQKAPRVRFAVVSCQDFTNGYYTTHAAIARDDVDFVVHLGDHIYETGGEGWQGSTRRDTIGGGEARTLDEYRAKYKLYLSDAGLREVRQMHPMICIWDDHELYNNYAGDALDAAGRVRQAEAYQAFAEYMPMPALTTTGVQMARVVEYGALASLFAIDQRQFRHGPVCGRDMFSTGCDAAQAEDRTMLGVAQKAWLKEALASSGARWKVLLSEVMWMPFKVLSWRRSLEEAALVDAYATLMGGGAALDRGGFYLNLDAWDGYPAERRELLRFARQSGVENLAVVTGDIHNFYAGEVHEDPEDARSPKVAVELVTASVTSKGISEIAGLPLNVGGAQALRLANRHLKWVDLKEHGYLRVELTDDGLECKAVAVETIRRPSSGVRVLRTLRAAAGNPELRT